MILRAATRGSPLARWQTDHVAGLLAAMHADVEVEPVVVSTEGDRRTDVSIGELAGRGVFVKEVQAAVLDGRADFAVHSAKDLTSAPVGGLTLAAIPLRGDARDALVGARLADLPEGGRVATGSARRRAQLGSLRPDLEFHELRGNIATRLEKAAGFDAIVLASVALERLGRSEMIAERLAVGTMIPQVAQGALAVECRIDDGATLAAVGAVEHEESRSTVDAERAFLATIGGGCELPVGAHATRTGSSLTLEGLLASEDGSSVIRRRATGGDAEAVGREVAHAVLRDGGEALLERLR